MRLRERIYSFYMSCLEALGIAEVQERIAFEISDTKETISLEISEVKESIVEALEGLFGEQDWRPILQRMAKASFVACGVLGLVGGVLLMANLVRSFGPLPQLHLQLPSLQLPSLHLDLDWLKNLTDFTSNDTSPTPAATPSPTPIPTYYVVGNTGQVGVYVRASTVMADKIKAWPDGTYMMQVGPDGEGNGQTWKNVQDPDGTVGWIPARFLIEAPAPSVTPAPKVTPGQP